MMDTLSLPTALTFGEALWQVGGVSFSPLAANRGRFRAMIVDLTEQRPCIAWSYVGKLHCAGKLAEDQAEATWADAGTIRIVANIDGGERRWYWSEPTKLWEIDRSPPEHVAEALLAAARHR